MIALGKVRMHDDAAYKRFAVVNGVVTGKVLSNALIRQVGVSDDGGGFIDDRACKSL